MVNFTKWVVIAAGLIFLGLFTQEAAATGLTGTLNRTGLSGGSIGSGVAAAGIGAGRGVGGFFVESLKPLWELRNIIRGYMNLGSATPWLEDTPEQGGGTNSGTGDGGGSDPIPVNIIQGTPDIYTGGGFSYYNDPRISSNPVTNTITSWASGSSEALPLTAEAVKFYQNLGVDVDSSTPSGGGISRSSGGGGGIQSSSQSSTYSAGAAQRSGYSMGSRRHSV